MRIMKKCPPGVLCIENMTLAFLVLALFLILYSINLKNANMNWDQFEDKFEKVLFGLAVILGTIAIVGRLIIIFCKL